MTVDAGSVQAQRGRAADHRATLCAAITARIPFGRISPLCMGSFHDIDFTPNLGPPESAPPDEP